MTKNGESCVVRVFDASDEVCLFEGTWKTFQLWQPKSDMKDYKIFIRGLDLSKKIHDHPWNDIFIFFFFVNAPSSRLVGLRFEVCRFYSGVWDDVSSTITRSLKSIVFVDCDLETFGAQKNFFPELEVLVISNSILKTVAPLRCFPKLKHLDISYTNLEGIDFHASSPMFEMINLSNNRLVDEKCIFIYSNTPPPSIHKAHVHNCGLSQTKLDELLSLVRAPSEPPSPVQHNDNSNNDGGLRFNNNKPRVDLVSPVLVERVAEVLTRALEKYPENNWRKGLKWNSQVASSLERHLLKFKRGEDCDEESGLLHVAHIAANAMFLLEYYETHRELDDRYFL